MPDSAALVADQPTMPLGENYPEIREAVAKLCEGFPGDYWREKDQARAYPTEFVKALTDAGFLGVLIPEEYGGSGLPISAGAAILETVHKSGCSGAACHAQMYTMGTVLRHGSEAQKRDYLPKTPRANFACRPLASPSRPAAPIRSVCAPLPCGKATNMSSMAKRCGPAGPNIQT
jgi:alkylation response protein AidB-like acyl-CoA dehydrogenase